MSCTGGIARTALLGCIAGAGARAGVCAACCRADGDCTAGQCCDSATRRCGACPCSASASCAAGSLLAFSYFDRELVARPGLIGRAVKAFVARVGEPFRFGWAPPELPAWMRARGFVLERDWSAERAAAELLPPRWARLVRERGRHFAVARRA